MNSKKDTLITILLILLIIIILSGLCIFAYKTIIVDTNNNIVNNTVTQENVISNNNINNNTIINQKTNEVSTVTSDSQEDDSTLTQIIDIFNNCYAANEMRSRGYSINATIINDDIYILSGGDGLSFTVKFVRNDNILSTEIDNTSSDTRMAYTQLLLSLMLVDCVIQTKGYPDRAFATTIADKESLDYTLENDGVEIKKSDDGNYILVNVDLDSDFSFLNT